MYNIQDKMDFYNDKIELFSTNIEMLSRTKIDENAFVKVSSVASAVIVPTAGIASYYLSNLDVNQIALYVMLATFGCASSITAVKKLIESKNKDIDFKISDNLREIDILSNKLSLLEQQKDDEISSVIVENSANILNKRTM